MEKPLVVMDKPSLDMALMYKAWRLKRFMIKKNRHLY